MVVGLVLVTGTFPPDIGGPSKFSAEFSNWVKDKSIPVETIAYSDTASESLWNNQIPLHLVTRSPNLLTRYFSMVRSIGKVAQPKYKVLAVGAFLEVFVASIIYRFEYAAKVPGDIVWERARNLGLTNSNILDFQSERLSIKYRLFRIAYSMSLRRAKRVIVPSQGLFELCQSWGVHREKLTIVYNSVDLKTTFSSQAKLVDYDLLTVCRLTSWKGVNELIEYCAARSLRLCVVGDGPERKNLERLGKALNCKIFFAGEINRDQIEEFFARSRIFVLNSYYEGLPHALIESRATGMIAVGRSGTGSEEVINDGVDGFLVTETRSLFETLDEALRIESVSNSLGSKAAQDTRLRFNQNINFERILEVVSVS